MFGARGLHHGNGPAVPESDVSRIRGRCWCHRLRSVNLLVLSKEWMGMGVAGIIIHIVIVDHSRKFRTKHQWVNDSKRVVFDEGHFRVVPVQIWKAIWGFPNDTCSHSNNYSTNKKGFLVVYGTRWPNQSKTPESKWMWKWMEMDCQINGYLMTYQNHGGTTPFFIWFSYVFISYWG